MKDRPGLVPVHIGQLAWAPVGMILVAASEKGAVALDMGNNDFDSFSHSLEDKRTSQVVPGDDFVRDIVKQLEEYFAGTRRGFDILVDYRRMTAFQQSVYELARQIPAGSFGTYGRIADKLDQPKGARAVGQALARNPIPIIIPCHRVISKAGSLQGYSAKGGIKTKQLLLTLEGVMLL